MTGETAGSASLAGAQLTLNYDTTTVVHQASIELRAGEVMALVGPNGSGKSTLLRSLARLHTPQSGAITLNNPATVDALALHPKEFARRVTLLTQSRPTPGGVTVRDVVGYGRHPYRRRFGGADSNGTVIIDRAMQITGVTAMARRAVDELSGGELQRVWLAMCLAQDTGVILLDEPTTFLDLRYQVETLDLIRDLADEHGVAVGVVLHDLDQAAAVADQITLLQHGTVRAVGTPPQVLTAELLSEVYGLQIEVRIDHQGRVRTEPVGRHSSRNYAIHASHHLVS